LEETRKELATGVEKLRADGGVSFIYDAPPTFEKWNDNRERRKKEIEGKYLYEWQKNAPRHRFVDEVLPTDIAASTNLHNPFGIAVARVTVPCFRCGELGHVAYEKTCPKYHEDMTNEEKRQRGTNYFLIEVEPSRLDRLVTEFNRDYDSYHGTVDCQERLKKGYFKKRVELNPGVVNELKLQSEIDNAKDFKDEDEKYIESLDPMERKLLFTTIRRIIREKKRSRKIHLLEEEKYDEAERIEVSDDSDSDGEYELGVNDVEEEFTKILDEMVFGAPEPASVKIERADSPAKAPHPISGDIAAEIKLETDPDLPSLEEKMRKRLTKRKCQEIVIQKNIKEEFQELEHERKSAELIRKSPEKDIILEIKNEVKAEGELEKDPLAEAVMVYVAEGNSKEEVQKNLLKLEEEKKKSIEARMKEKIKKRRESLEMMEEQILKGVNIEDVTEETRALYKIKFRKEQGAEAINKLHSLNEQIRKLNEKIVEEEAGRKAEKEDKYQRMANRSQAEILIRERLEKRKEEAEKKARQREREEKRKLKKMSKKLNKLKEANDERALRDIGLAPLGEISKLQMKRKSDSDMLDLGLGLASTSSSKPIKVYTKEKRKRADSETSEPARPSSSEVKFEKEIDGRKHTIDQEFLQKFGITLD